MDNVVYRKAVIDDAYGIASVSAYSWMETYLGLMPSEFLENKILEIDKKTLSTKEFLKNTDTYYVALVNDKIVGILHYDKSLEDSFKNYGHLGAVYVLKDYQGLGIGKNLFKIALHGILDLGFNDMFLICVKGNNTIGFYKKYGGKVISVVDYPIGDFTVKADVVVFNDIKTILNKIT